VSILSDVANSNAPTDVKKAATHALGNIDSPASKKALIKLIENQ